MSVRRHYATSRYRHNVYTPRRWVSRLALPLLTSSLLLVAGCTGGSSADQEGSSASGTDAAELTDAVQTEVAEADAVVVVAYADHSAETGGIEAAALVQGVVETGGSCVLSASREGGDPVTGPPSEAEPGPSSTECGVLSLALPAESAGTWSVSVSYTSPSSDLTSEPVEVHVP